MISRKIITANSGEDTLTIIDRKSYCNKKTINLKELIVWKGERFGPSDMAINDLDQLLIINSYDDSLIILDLFTNAIIDIIKLGRFPNAIKIFNESIFVLNSDSNCLTILEEDSLNIIENIYIGGKPTGIEIDRERNRVYIPISDEYSIGILNLDNFQLAKIKLQAQPLKVILDDNIIYILSYVNNGTTNFSCILALGAEDDKIIWSKKIKGIYYDFFKREGEDYIYLVNPEDGYLYGFNIEIKELEKIIYLGGMPNKIVSDNKEELYITDLLNNNIIIVDILTRKKIKKIRVGKEPQGILLL